LIELPQVELTDAEQCHECGGKCCSNIGLPPFEVANPEFGHVSHRRLHSSDVHLEAMIRDTETFLSMPSQLRLEHAAHVLGGSRSRQPCVWLVDGKCGHYEHRPYNCVRWEVGSQECVNAKHKGAIVVGVDPWIDTLGYWLNPRDMVIGPTFFAKLRVRIRYWWSRLKGRP